MSLASHIESKLFVSNTSPALNLTIEAGVRVLDCMSDFDILFITHVLAIAYDTNATHSQSLDRGFKSLLVNLFLMKHQNLS